MKILLLHSDFIEYEPVKKEVEEAEECEKKRTRFEEVVVLFTTVEKNDTEEVAQKAIREIKSLLENLKVNRLLIYPYAHLSSDLAKSNEARKIVTEMERYALELGIEAYRTPFGWNKQFTISVKGHPLAEQSRSYRQEQEIKEKKEDIVPEAVKAEEKLASEWFIMDTAGELTPVDKFSFTKYTNLEKFTRYEISKVRAVSTVPPHVILMKRLEIADNEPGSDSGNLRFYPKGRLIKSLLEQYVTQKVIEYGGMEVETPVMYDFEHPSLKSYLNRFPARQYVVRSDDKDFFLRFSACFGQFLMAHDAQFSYKQLPFRIYELTRYSFRREKSGELVGLKRLRAFTMPDVHALCANLDQTLQEAVTRFQLATNVLEDGLELTKEDYELAIRFTKEFYQENKAFIISLVKLFGKPVLIEMWPKKFFYFTLKWEFNFIDNLDKASALSTDQIDVENAERYDIAYIDENGEKKYPLILHCSPSGAIERCIYALLERAYAYQLKNKVPRLPLWLSPTQVRAIPISDNYIQKCEEIINTLCAHQIRADIDDRKLTVQKRVREAEKEWIPYIICVGEREVTSEELAVRKRELGTVENRSLESLMSEIKEKTRDKPVKQLSLSQRVSLRPIFA